MNTSARRLINCHGSLYMPLVLKGVLKNYGIDQTTWAKAITQANGKPMSHSASTQLLNWNEWPKQTPEFSIKKQTEDWLLDQGVAPEDIKGIWSIDPEDRFRNQHPTGVHVGQHKGRPDTPEMEIREMLYPDTKKHFNLFRDPFLNDVTEAKDVYLPMNYRQTREAMIWAARNGNLIAVVGESGAGKSVLMRDAIERITSDDEQQMRIIQPQVIDKTRLTSGMITEAIIYDLAPDAKVRRSMEGKERQAQTLLKDSHKAGRRHVLVIEEAHDLSIHTLKLLKRYWEIVEGHRHLLGIILIGQPELQARLENHSYEARELINRLEIASLEPLGRDLEGYLDMKFKRVGAEMGDILGADAADAIRMKLVREVTSGKATSRSSLLYPLHVNCLVTRAMNKAAGIGMPRVNAEVIQTL